MPEANPFTYGNPVSDPRRFAGRERQLEQVFSRLRNAEFESSSIVGERRIGKTSLLLHLQSDEVQHAYGIAPEAPDFLYFDLQLVGHGISPGRFWPRILRPLVRRVADDTLTSLVAAIPDGAALDPFALDDVFIRLDEIGRRVVLLLDEFELITQNPSFDEDFFYALRALATHHSLALITSSRRSLINLTHSDVLRASPFFNIFAHVPLGLFDDKAVDRVLGNALDGSSVSFTQDERDAVKALAGNFPYFVQVAGYFLFSAHIEHLDAPGRLALLQRSFVREAEPHFREAWQASGEREKILLTAAAFLENTAGASPTSLRTFHLKDVERLHDQAPQAMVELEDRGLLRPGPPASLFSSAFGAWIRSEISASAAERESFDEWLSHNAAIGTRANRDLKRVLPRIASAYRPLVLAWASNPAVVGDVAHLLGGVLGV